MSRSSFNRFALAVRLIGMVLAGIHSTANAHPSDEWTGPSLALTRWADAVNMGDPARIAALTAEGASPFLLSNDTTLSAGHATFTREDDGVVAAPVIMSTDLGTFVSGLAVRLVKADTGWVIASAIPGAPVPPGLFPTNLPEHAELVPVAFRILDNASGDAIYARVRITDAAGAYWPPAGHQKNIRIGWRQDVGGDVQVDGETYAYVTPEFTAYLPIGRYEITVHRGMEYTPTTQAFDVGKDNPESVEVLLSRWAHMNKRAWYSGDTHTHFLSEKNAQFELRGEDLNVLYVLATKWGELITDAEKFTGRPIADQPRGEVAVYNQETRHNFFGHTIMHGIDQLVYPMTWGGPSEGVYGGYDYPSMASLADRAHELGGLVTWAHFPFPSGELSTDIALGKIDTVDLMTWADIYHFPQPLSTVELWYAYLNTGSRIAATAGTDKMLNTQVSGSVRTYARVKGRFDYEKWLASLKAGRTFVTTGPMLDMTVNGKDAGSELKLKAGQKITVEVAVDAPPDLYPFDAVEVVAGGQVVATQTGHDATRTVLTAEIEVPSSTWIAARVRSAHVLPHQRWAFLNAPGVPVMAHTSPVYIDIDGAPIWDAETAKLLAADIQRGIDWINTTGNYRTDAEREEVLALFRSAQEHYLSGPRP